MFKTVGVYYYRDEIARVSNEHGDLVMADLRIEETGQYAGAVRVFVQGLMVGSIAHDMAEDYREVIPSTEPRGASGDLPGEHRAGRLR